MINISLDTANLIHTVGSVIAIVSAFIAASTGLMTFIASTVQSRYADQKIAEANSLSAVANDAAARANHKTEELVKQNLELSLKLEAEKKERLRIETTLGPRTISRDSASSLITKLHGLDKSKVRVVIARSEAEVENYAAMIVMILQSAGIDVIAERTLSFSTGSN